MVRVAFDAARAPSSSGFLVAMGGDHRAERVLFMPPPGYGGGGALGFVKLGGPGQPAVKKALAYDAALGGYEWLVERAEVRAVAGIAAVMAQFTLESRDGEECVCWESRAFPIAVNPTIEADALLETQQPVYLLELDMRVAAAVARAEAAAQALSQPAAEAETLPNGAAATVAVDATGGAVTYRFGLPRGEKGDKGDTGSLDDNAQLQMRQITGLAGALDDLATGLAAKSDAGHAHAEYLTDVSGKLDLAGGAMTGALVAGGAQQLVSWQARNIAASETDLEAGVSPLTTGRIYLRYE
ncbi:hypothetical protein ACH6CV_14550 [Bacillota bacterium Meth-B3]